MDKYVLIDQDHIDKLQKCLLLMLQDLSVIFEKADIKACLSGGSLLGKIRHNGFIPWDDDFDIFVTREDYIKLLDIFENNKWNIGDKFEFRGPGYSKGAEVRIAKIYKKDSVYEPVFSKKNAMKKIFIDVFIIDNVPEKQLLKVFKGLQTLILIGIIGCVETKINVIRERDVDLGWQWNLQYILRIIIGSVFSIIPLQEWYNKLYRVAEYNKQTGYCTVPTGMLFYFNETVPRDFFFPFKETDFYGIPIWIPNDAENYLLNRYGDWKHIPSESERGIHFCKKIDYGKDFEILDQN